MRLIDADELIKRIENSRNNNPHKDCRVKRNHDIEHYHFIKMVYDQPTAFEDWKGIIVMDIPKNCGECRFYRQFVGFAQSCVISGRDVDSRCKPSWCPIKQVSNSERGMKAWED